jgi:hypothetical protein
MIPAEAGRGKPGRISDGPCPECRKLWPDRCRSCQLWSLRLNYGLERSPRALDRNRRDEILFDLFDLAETMRLYPERAKGVRAALRDILGDER